MWGQIKKKVADWFFVAGLFISNSLVYFMVGVLVLRWLKQKFFSSVEEKSVKPDTGDKVLLWFLGLFIGWRVLSVIFSINFSQSLNEAASLGLFVLLYLCRTLARNFQDIKKLVLVNLSVGFLACLYAVVQYIRLSPEHAEGFYGGYSMFATFLAMNLTLLAAFIFSEKNFKVKIWLTVFFLAAGLALLLTRERGPWLGALLGLVVAGFLVRDKQFWVTPSLAVLLVAVLVLAAGLHGPVVSKIKDLVALKSSGRTVLWKAALEQTRQHPFLGSGISTFRQVCSRAVVECQDPNVSGPHNAFLQIAFESGIPALLFYLGFWGTFLFQVRKVYNKTKGETRVLVSGMLGVFAGYLLMSFFGTGGSDMELVYLFFLMGITLGLKPGPARVKGAA